jgi:16S rRNA (cytidine1402-2'-O)-methyltransferase
MSLTMVATPIGNPQDITLRALEILKSAEVIIVEEFKESTQILRAHGISGKTFEQLNEHSTPEDLERLVKLCLEKKVALITDCGTPGFCDPGSQLVKLCRNKNIKVETAPGASSLMSLLSLSSKRIDHFLFRGFLPAENESRKKAWLELSQINQAIIMLDTPYRFQKTLSELDLYLPNKQLLVGINMTQADELVLEGIAKTILNHPALPKKAEFMILIYP